MDREKVIKGLECHRIDSNHRINCTDCPYYVDDDNHINCVNDLHDDAIALLKEQEAKPPKITGNAYGVKFYFCPRCSRPIIKSSAIGKPRHCEDCGQAVKWE